MSKNDVEYEETIPGDDEAYERALKSLERMMVLVKERKKGMILTFIVRGEDSTMTHIHTLGTGAYEMLAFLEVAERINDKLKELVSKVTGGKFGS